MVDEAAERIATAVAQPGPIADLGCGPGAHALALARRGYHMFGLDGSPRMVEVARSRAARDKVEATFDVHDVNTRLPFAEASLGGALAILVIQHLRRPENFIAEIRRCLRPGGHLLITAPTRPATPLGSSNMYWRVRAACVHRVPGVIGFYDPDSLTQLLSQQGLTVVEHSRQSHSVTVTARI